MWAEVGAAQAVAGVAPSGVRCDGHTPAPGAGSCVRESAFVALLPGQVRCDSWPLGASGWGLGVGRSRASLGSGANGIEAHLRHALQDLEERPEPQSRRVRAPVGAMGKGRPPLVVESAAARLARLEWERKDLKAGAATGRAPPGGGSPPAGSVGLSGVAGAVSGTTSATGRSAGSAGRRDREVRPPRAPGRRGTWCSRFLSSLTGEILDDFAHIGGKTTIPIVGVAVHLDGQIGREMIGEGSCRRAWRCVGRRHMRASGAWPWRVVQGCRLWLSGERCATPTETVSSRAVFTPKTDSPELGAQHLVLPSAPVVARTSRVSI